MIEKNHKNIVIHARHLAYYVLWLSQPQNSV